MTSAMTTPTWSELTYREQGAVINYRDEIIYEIERFRSQELRSLDAQFDGQEITLEQFDEFAADLTAILDKVRNRRSDMAFWADAYNRQMRFGAVMALA